jgi:hypothetical protein
MKILSQFQLAIAITIATHSVAYAVVVTVPGTSDPWLAGMPNGSTASSGDTAPAQSPILVSGFALNAGEYLNFTATGGTHFGPGPLSPPDGGIVDHHHAGAQNGLSDVTAPADALMGVFLSASQPNLTAAPAALNFSTSVSRDFVTLSPLLKQVFFIGDGRTSAGVRQLFQVPSGATRLFLGTMDGEGWFNNVGSLTVTIGLAGDFNLDGHVDAADYVMWRKGLDTTFFAGEYVIWQANFGESTGSGGNATANTAIPEPASFLMLALAILIVRVAQSPRQLAQSI